MKQIVRFLIVGGFAFLVESCVLWVFVDLFGVNYLVSSALSFSISVVFNYILSTIWVFQATGNEKNVGSFMVFVLLSIVGLLLNLAIMRLGVDLLESNYLIAKIGATGIVMAYNFITRKFILERNLINLKSSRPRQAKDISFKRWYL